MIDPLVTLEAAKAHLRITSTDEDEDIERKMSHATAAIVDYLKEFAVSTWDIDTAPGVVQAAILKQLGHLWRFRGDEDVTNIRRVSDEDDDGLAPGVKGLLKRMRDPTLA